MSRATDALASLKRHNDELEIKCLTLGTQLTRAEAQLTTLQSRLDAAIKVIEPFAEVAEYDIGTDELDSDKFHPMSEYNCRVPLLTVGDLRAAAQFIRDSAAKDNSGEGK